MIKLILIQRLTTDSQLDTWPSLKMPGQSMKRYARTPSDI